MVSFAKPNPLSDQHLVAVSDETRKPEILYPVTLTPSWPDAYYSLTPISAKLSLYPTEVISPVDKEPDQTSPSEKSSKISILESLRNFYTNMREAVKLSEVDCPGGVKKNFRYSIAISVCQPIMALATGYLLKFTSEEWATENMRVGMLSSLLAIYCAAQIFYIRLSYKERNLSNLISRAAQNSFKQELHTVLQNTPQETIESNNFQVLHTIANSSNTAFYSAVGTISSGIQNVGIMISTAALVYFSHGPLGILVFGLLVPSLYTHFRAGLATVALRESTANDLMRHDAREALFGAPEYAEELRRSPRTPEEISKLRELATSLDRKEVNCENRYKLYLTNIDCGIVLLGVSFLAVTLFQKNLQLFGMYAWLLATFIDEVCKFGSEAGTLAADYGPLKAGMNLLRNNRHRLLHDSATKTEISEQPVPTIKRGLPLVLRNVGYSFESRINALRNINLEIHPERHIAIVGFNGSGKSTLGRILAGDSFQRVTGEVMYDGVNLLKEPRELHDQLTLRLLQDPPSFFSYKFSEMLAWHTNHPPETVSKELFDLSGPVWKLIEPVWYRLKDNTQNGENPFIHEIGVYLPNGEKLSGGQQKRLDIARILWGVLEQGKEFVVFDELFAGLDKPSTESILRLLSKIRGTTIILLMHEIERLLDKDYYIIAMDKGEIVQQGYPQDLIRDEKGSFYKLLNDRETNGDIHFC